VPAAPPSATGTSAPASAAAAPATSPAPPATIATRGARRRGHLDLGAAFRYALPLDGGDPEPGGLITVGVRWRRLLVLVSAGVEAESTAAVQGSGALAVRRIPLRAGVAYELSLPRSALRFELGPMLALASARSTGIAHPGSTLVLLPGAYAAVGYHLGLVGPLTAFVGLDLETSFVRESLAVTGAGAVEQLPLVWLCPRVGLGLDFL
jgi:hypothetical protein